MLDVARSASNACRNCKISCQLGWQSSLPGKSVDLNDLKSLSDVQSQMLTRGLSKIVTVMFGLPLLALGLVVWFLDRWQADAPPLFAALAVSTVLIVTAMPLVHTGAKLLRKLPVEPITRIVKN